MSTRGGNLYRCVVTTALALVAAACSPSSGGAPVDGGGGKDGGPPQDAAADAPTLDAPHDAPPDVQPPDGTPIWEDLPFQVVGCTMQRLVNAAELKIFNWKPCDTADNCSEAVWHQGIIGTDGEIGRRTTVHDDGRVVRIGIRYDSDVAGEAGVVVAAEDGSILLGLRLSTSGPCTMNIPNMGGGRFGVLAAQTPSDAGPLREGGLLAALDDLSTLTPFEIDPLPPGSGPDHTAMGDSRWLWRFAPDQLTTFSNVDGTGFTVFAKISPSVVLLTGPSATGPSFLFDVLEVPDGGAPEGYIGRSDGVAPFERFISGSPTAWVGAPMFAHSHIGWQKGLNPKNINDFESVELWASPYSEDAAALAPYKVGNLVAKNWGWIGGGWGRYVTIGKPETNTQHDFLVWDLEKKTNLNIVLPADRYFEACPGLTRSAFWVVPGLVSSSQRGLMRFSL